VGEFSAVKVGDFSVVIMKGSQLDGSCGTDYVRCGSPPALFRSGCLPGTQKNHG